MNIHDIELPPEFQSGNSIPVERATITRERMTEILKDAIEADRQRRGISNECEPVGYIMPTALKQLKAGGHAVVGGVSQGFDVPIYTAPQPAEPVKVPSDSEIMWEWANTKNTGDMRIDLVAFARAVLARYGQPVPPEGWRLVPKELIDFLDAKEHHLPVEDRHVLSVMLTAAPEPPCAL